ncbi:hypothetical protein CYMTET_35213 [Cymbomonas tetramitiformis]|uniref:Uncharacterized protein n=1 Tax=Cymbomonas tetramitiformis TaxID=36881 RepID=A0AAE0KP49_9CHLO|nr:hypothetical protein CYMTET_35213 [Cymbomonas tetramitiformis]
MALVPAGSIGSDTASGAHTQQLEWDLTQQLEARRELQERLDQQIEEYEKSQRAKEGVDEELAGERASRAEETARYEECERELREELRAVQERLEAEREEVRATLEGKLAAKESELQATKAQLESKLNEKDAELARMKSGLERCAGERDQLESELAQTRAHFTAFQEEAASSQRVAEATISRLGEERSEFKAQLETQLEENKRLEGEKAALTAALEQANASVHTLHADMEKMRQDHLAEVQRMEHERSEERERLCADIAELQDAKQKVEAECAMRIDERDAALRLVEDVTGRLREQEQRTAEVTAQLASVQGELAACTAELNAEQLGRAELQKAHDATKAQLAFEVALSTVDPALLLSSLPCSEEACQASISFGVCGQDRSL